MADEPKQVFISYSSVDSKYAEILKFRLQKSGLPLAVWMAPPDIKPGDRIATEIELGLSGSDYFLLLVSAASKDSDWVKREVSYAFDLAIDRQISLIPFVLDSNAVPLEFRGLLYIDGSEFEKGIDSLISFFQTQLTRIDVLEDKLLVQKSDDEDAERRNECQRLLRKLELGDLRFQLAKRLGVDEVQVLWYDVFNVRMEDAVNVRNVSLSLIELLDRCRRNDLLLRLIEKLCRNHPTVAKGSIFL